MLSAVKTKPLIYCEFFENRIRGLTKILIKIIRKLKNNNKFFAVSMHQRGVQTFMSLLAISILLLGFNAPKRSSNNSGSPPSVNFTAFQCTKEEFKLKSRRYLVAGEYERFNAPKRSSNLSWISEYNIVVGGFNAPKRSSNYNS